MQKGYPSNVSTRTGAATARDLQTYCGENPEDNRGKTHVFYSHPPCRRQGATSCDGKPISAQRVTAQITTRNVPPGLLCIMLKVKRQKSMRTQHVEAKPRRSSAAPRRAKPAVAVLGDVPPAATQLAAPAIDRQVPPLVAEPAPTIGLPAKEAQAGATITRAHVGGNDHRLIEVRD